MPTSIEALEQLIKKYGSMADVAEKIGFSRETRLKKNGKIASSTIDSAVMKLYASDFDGGSVAGTTSASPKPEKKSTSGKPLNKGVSSTSGTAKKPTTGTLKKKLVKPSSSSETVAAKKTVTAEKTTPQIKEETQYFKDRFSNSRLFYRKFLVADANRVMVVVHGVGEHSYRYLNLIKHFTARQTNMYLMDNRGHGRSEGPRGHIDAFTQYLDDLYQFLEIVRQAEPGKPVFLLGHSLGGNIVGNYITQREQNFAGVILSAPGFAPGFDVPVVKKLLGQLTSQYVPTLALPTGLESSGLSRDPKVIEDYDNDPLVHDLVSSRFYTEYTRYGQLAVANADMIKCPLLVIQGTADSTVSIPQVEKFFNNLTVKDRQIEWFDGFYHECFNDIGKEQVFDILEKWVNAH
ncbi:MAG: alpha/beta fold hydrolase [SAR324 cluster bacterium]|nr:alpha/beta fold hydrolase [SAR324 cluster bacterium]